MMKQITLWVEEDVHRKIKYNAYDENKTIKAYMLEILQREFQRVDAIKEQNQKGK